MADLELVRVRCTSCGADFEDVKEDQEVFTCKRFGCGATFRVSHGKLFALIDKEKTEKIANHRKALYEALDDFRTESVFEYASVITGMLPDDFRANIAQRLAQMKTVNADPRAFRNYISDCPAATETEFAEIFPYILKYAGYSELKYLERALPVYVKGEALKGIKKELSKAFEREESLNRDYADIHRDVFICHSSENADFAEQAYASLLGDGRKVWISTHNLQPHSRNYWEDIENAIEKCSVFLVIASKDAMMSRDVQREIMIAQKLNKPRVEIKIDAYRHTELFKDFFDGISWIDASKNEENALNLANKRVMELIKKAQEDLENAKKAKKTENSASKAKQANDDFTVEDVSNFVNRILHIIKTILAFFFPIFKKSLLKAKDKAVTITKDAVEGIKKSETFNSLKNKVNEAISEIENAQRENADDGADEEYADGSDCADDAVYEDEAVCEEEADGVEIKE